MAITITVKPTGWIYKYEEDETNALQRVEWVNWGNGSGSIGLYTRINLGSSWTYRGWSSTGTVATLDVTIKGELYLADATATLYILGYVDVVQAQIIG